MLYKYTATTPEGEKRSGTIEAANLELAVNSLQTRNLIIINIAPIEGGGGILRLGLSLFERVKQRDIVLLTRQLATLFESRVSIPESFKLLAVETENMPLKRSLNEVVSDIQGGLSVSQAMTKHPNVFSRFYISMVRTGEESGKLSEILSSLADYLERNLDLSNKAKNALVYPAFVIVTFIIVMILMFVFVVPRLSAIITETGQQIPIYTRIIIGISNFFRQFGLFILLGLGVGLVFLWKYLRTESGKLTISNLQISIPYVGGLYKKFYISRMTDNLETLLSSGISAVRSLEITAEVVGNNVYNKILMESANEVRAGQRLSETFSHYKEIPALVTQMIRVGEESGRLNFTLKSLSNFYKKEVNSAVGTLVSLIEPIMLVVLGVSVGFILVSILIPIYNITAGM